MESRSLSSADQSSGQLSSSASVSELGASREMEGGPGAFEVNILPEGNICQIASSLSHKMSKRQGKLFNGRGDELVHSNLESALSQFVTYLERVKELSIKPVYLVIHGTIDIPNLMIALDCVGLLDSVLSKIAGFINFELIVWYLERVLYKNNFVNSGTDSELMTAINIKPSLAAIGPGSLYTQLTGNSQDSDLLHQAAYDILLLREV